MNVKIKIKKLHPDAKMPHRGTADAAGFDLYATRSVTLRNGVPEMVPTGLAFEIPKGYVGVVYSRSSSAKSGLIITPLLVDADYRGEVFVLVNNLTHNDAPREILTGDRVAQIRIERLVDTEYEWSEELSETERGSGGYGSTGR